ncbi:MAG TPA: nucleotidyltransferase domain-containing protein [SAR324 cluster bacterium]|jgi:predicted nucleotidyltransferase|nr:nucleotidyltransferase domain-containing protein [SAR324 cluster bacterium]HJO43620.1 nucleotidyltransferase domain-containing protein [SAR324 cluster bacterium]|tara:strand:+ start:399 stop:683 length:285 start_codon:yes stop_codon:yes gene_type:complete
MRLTATTQNTIRDTILKLDSKATVILFGSRTSDSTKGGDIDLLVISETLTGRDLRKIKIHLQDQLGMQRFDIVLTTSDLSDPFAKMAFEEGISL